MRGVELYSSPRSITIAAAALADADGIKTAIATNVAAQSYSGAALDGVLASPGPATLDPPRFASVTTAVSAATYNVADPIVVTGTRAGQTVTESLTLTNANGGEAIVGDQPFDTIVSYAVPAQLGGGGSFQFGVSGIACRAERKGEVTYQVPYRRVRVGAAGGTVHFGFSAGYTDTVTYPADTSDELLIERVYADSTADPVTVYW